MMQPREAIRAALEDVADMQDDDLRRLAFKEVLRSHLSASPFVVAERQNDLAAATGRGEPSVDGADTPQNRLAQKTGVDLSIIERLFDFGADEATITVAPSKLSPSKAGATEQIALLICAARQAGLRELETNADAIRAACIDFGRYDEANFMSTLRELAGFIILGGTTRARTCRITRSGYERAAALTASLIGQ